MSAQDIFDYYANFGSGSRGSDQLDIAKFGKMCKETGVFDSRFTNTDTDLIFKKVLPKGERKMRIDDFQQALVLMAAAKYGSEAGSESKKVSKLVNQMANNLPGGGSDAKKPAIFDRLTDTRLYTGSHKNRFDEDGNGRGMEGRDIGAKGSGHIASHTMGKHEVQLQSILRTNLNSGPQFTVGDVPSSAGRPQSREQHVMNELDHHLFQKASPRPAPTSARAQQGGGGGGGGGVFNRLCDSNQYTGAHKHRFNSDGTGRGIAGRDTGAVGRGSRTSYQGGAVSDLSQITRSNLR